MIVVLDQDLVESPYVEWVGHGYTPTVFGLISLVFLREHLPWQKAIRIGLIVRSPAQTLNESVA